MNPQNTHILTLIKLREGHLSHAEGLAVREQLASDSDLLQHWKTLSKLYEQPNARELIEEKSAAAIDAESIAAFVEEKMSFEQSREFESECWNHTDLLSEVISAYQSRQGDNKSDSLSEQYQRFAAQTLKRMNEMIDVQCQKEFSLSSSCHYLQDIEDRPLSHVKSTMLDSSESSIESKGHPSQSVRFNRKSHKQQMSYVVIAVVLVLIVIPVYFGLIQEPEKIRISDKPASKSPPPAHQKILPDSTDALPVKVVPKLTVLPEGKLKDESPEQSPQPVPLPPVMNHQDDEKPLVAKKGTASDPLTKLELQFEWTRISGIVGYRSLNSMPWRGIRADLSAKQFTDKKQLELHTLPFSWLQGNIRSASGSSGSEIVLDADSEIQLAIQATKPLEPTRQVSSESNALQSTIDLNLIAGRVAFSQLKAGDHVHFKNQRQAWDVRVKEDHTSIGFIQQKDNRREIIVFSGAVQVLSLALEQSISVKSDQMIVMRDHTLGTTMKIHGTQSWIKVAPKKLKLNDSFVQKMNESDDLVSALFSPTPDKVGLELLASTNLSFALDPVATVSQAAFSNSKVQRTAAIAWLLAAQENSTTEAVWRKINIASSVGPTTPDVRNWFMMAKAKAPRNQKVLSELSAGLGAMQPLFVRQCSIHFLRQLTRLRLAEYDARKPTGAAINSVRQKLRRATGNSRPITNTRPTGNNNQRRK